MTFNLTRSWLRGLVTASKRRNYHSLISTKEHSLKRTKYQNFKYFYSPITWKAGTNSVENTSNTEADEFSENESPYAEIDFASVTGNDEEKIRQLKLIQLEIDMLRQQGDKVPTRLTVEHWIELLNIKSSESRKKYYSFRWTNELREKEKKIKKAKKMEEYMKIKSTRPTTRIQETTSTPLVYDLSRTTLFFRIYDAKISNMYNMKLFYASMFAPHIIVDCSYEPFMTEKNMYHCAKQMLLMWSYNRDSFNPYHLVFCNVPQDSFVFNKLRKTLPIDDVGFPFFFTSKHYLELYPKNRMVYLTPHCTDDLVSYNKDDIYIIGGFVDQCNSDPISLAKAKKERIRMAKFPLDSYLRWQRGHKTLTLNQCLSIMDDLKDRNDWNYAFRHVPTRKLRPKCEYTIMEDDEKLEKKSNRISAKGIREEYRRNLVYDLILKRPQKLEDPS